MLAHDEAHDTSPPPIVSKRRPGPKHPKYGIPTEHWPILMQRVVESKKSLRAIAHEYGVSHETIRRIIRHVLKQRGQQEALLCSNCPTTEALCASGLIGTQPA